MGRKDLQRNGTTSRELEVTSGFKKQKALQTECFTENLVIRAGLEPATQWLKATY